MANWWEYPWWEGQGHSSPADWVGAPWDEWFYWRFDDYWTFTDRIASGFYWMYRVSATPLHRSQILIKANGLVYVFTLNDELPAYWGEFSQVVLSPPCGNTALYVGAPYQIRSQTWEMQAAVQADVSSEYNVESAVAKTDYLELDIEAAVQGNPSLSLDIRAAVQGDDELTFYARAAVRGEPELAPEVEAAVAHDFELSSEVEAAVQGNPYVTVRMQAAVLGEAETTVNIVALVLKNRTEAIILEMENNWPQSLGQESVPNWPSKARHWGREPLV